MSTLLEVEHVGKRFGDLVALADVSFEVRAGETFGLVGESGCGKSTLARCILRLLEPSSGRVSLDGIDLGALRARELRALRSRAQIVLQDATAALDARMTVRALVEEPLAAHGVRDRAERRRRAEEALALVGIAPQQLDRKPHAFSGGQRQRIGLARALVLRPELLVLDEPVSAVDVSLQAQILNLLADLQAELGLTYVLIVHDLAVAEHVCDRIAVLYLGRIVELAERDALFARPLHPYSVSLLSAIPIPDPAVEQRRERIVLDGDVDPAQAHAGGCVFRSRCPVGREREICAAESPPLTERAPGQQVACHFAGELTLDAIPSATPTPTPTGAQ